MSQRHHRRRVRRPSCLNAVFLVLCCLGGGQQLRHLAEEGEVTPDVIMAAAESQETRRAAEGKSFASMEGSVSGSSESIPWIRLQPARLSYVKNGTLADKRHNAWQHWAAITFSCLAIMVVAAHFVVCFRGMCSKGAGTSDPSAQQQLNTTGHSAATTIGMPVDRDHPLHTLISSGEGPPSSPGQGPSGSRRGANGKSGPRQQLQFDRFVVRGANTTGSYSGYPGLPSAVSKTLSAEGRLGPRHGGYNIVNKWADGSGGGARSVGYQRPGYVMRGMFDIASDEDDDDIEDQGTAAGEVYYGLDGRARVVQYPQTLLVPEDDETPEEFAARRKRQKAYEHPGGGGGGGGTSWSPPPASWRR
ncbi:hypothetical protein FOL46_009036 [Perkinsus olseni]|nr:hypothetical protein FOL46_009036 [Perkinsus olseni]